MKVFIIGYVWPEPQSSAAGTRMMQIISLFQKENWEVVFATSAQESENKAPLESLGIKTLKIQVNDASFDTLIQEMQPDIVLLDRFMMEEQYGWRVRENCPEAIQILDTEDLHSLRNARLQAKKKNTTEMSEMLKSDISKREIASIFRSDLTLIISKKEMELLQETFKVPEHILFYLPFLEKELTEETVSSWKTFEKREDLCFIGNFFHEPNWQTVQILKKEIWPKLRKKLPKAKLHIYGAYAGQKVLQLNNPTENFIVKGFAEDVNEVMKNHKICIAPIPFGAGLKGKFIDAMKNGCPSVTTSVGAESMFEAHQWPGFISDDYEKIISETIKIYTEKDYWNSLQKNGISIINDLFSVKLFAKKFIETISNLDLEKHRENNFYGQILQHHSLKSTKYMSKWIEEKNKKLT
ncbi:glycosyltransferase family 4 protein [Aureivirga sp. CE67]|uniref:glycosyltransferase family 4 protein n=1 Tax=Aureivirga sp. CE67 TaxID=1788983 RepID=UPI0018CBB63B|nr:glycosyltransferase family 4 protein [Aureivirga sp. CE67]